MKRYTGLICVILTTIAALSSSATGSSVIDLDGEKNPGWWLKSMESRDQRLQWYREAKFGMFVHWGVYARLAGEWKGEIAPGYSEHILRTLKIPLSVYASEVAANFNPVEFDADEWIRLCKAAGMRYFVITAKHHDGFAMWPSDVNEWDIDDASPFDRDPLAELRDACRKHGIHFGFYYSQAQDWAHPGGQRNTWDYPDNPGDDRFWYDKPEFAAHVKKSEQYIVEKSIPQMLEIIERYQPEIIWFDTSSWVPLYQNKMVLQAMREAGPEIVVSSRIGGDLGDYQSTTDQPDDFQQYQRQYDTWEGIPTTNLSYGYHRLDKTHKPASFFIELLAKGVERGGNLLMNIGPMGDGRIDPTDVEILEGIGKWMDVNGESIYGTTHTPLAPQSFGHVSRKGNFLYLHVTRWPVDGKLVLSGLDTPIERAWLLAAPQSGDLSVSRKDASDWIIRVPLEPVDPVNTVIKVKTKGTPAGDPDGPIRISGNIPEQRLHVFDSHEKSAGLRFGSGNPSSNGIIGWGKNGGTVRWKVRVDEPTEFDLDLVYVAVEGTHGGSYALSVGGESFTQPVVTQPVPEHQKLVKYIPHYLGKVMLEPGVHEIVLQDKEISGRELFMPSSLLLRPHRQQ